MERNSAVLIRFVISALFLWFGTQQLLDAGAWVGFLPEFSGYLPIPGEMLVQLNGLFEVVAGLMLFAGVYTRVVAFLLGAHLAAISLTVGGAIGVRDATLAAVTLALAWSAPDEYTYDQKQAKRASATPITP